MDRLELDVSHLRIARCRHGLMLFNLRDAYVGRSLDIYGEYSEGEVGIFAQVLGAGMFVVDVGANIGAHTVPLARMVGPSGRVIAFEPQRTLFQMLCANLAINGFDNVEAHWAAASSTSGGIAVPALDYTEDNNFGGIALDGGCEVGYQVPVMTIDGLRLGQCRLIKIDVEGMEEKVIQGAAATIRHLRPALYVENHESESSPSLIETIFRLGYRAWWHLVPLFNRANFRGATENIFGGTSSISLFCVHASATADIGAGLVEVESPESDWRALLARI